MHLNRNLYPLPMARLTNALALVACSCLLLGAAQIGQGGGARAGLSALLPGQAAILPVDEAFRVSLSVGESGRKLYWQITPGYYLYKEKITASLDGKPLPLALPAGIPRQDEAFGLVEVYDGYVEASLPSGEEPVLVRYQGCAEAGYCYPPVEKTLP